MSRIFKNSTFKMQLLVADNINTSIDGLSFKFHTTDPNIYVEVFDNYTLKANIAILTIGSTLFSALDEGVLTYEVRGYFNGEYVTIERQSNYFLKYSNSIPQVNLQEKYLNIYANGFLEIYPDDGFNGMSKVDVAVNIQPNLGHLYADFGDYDGEGNYWRYGSDDGFDGFNYIKINASAYGEQKRTEGYNQGYQDGYNAATNPDTPIESGKWGITGYYNSWGGTPDTYFETYNNQILFEEQTYDMQVIWGFESDGQEIKIRYNNEWNYSYSAELYNIPQIRPLIVSDMNIDLPSGIYNIYILGHYGDEKFEPEYIVFTTSTSDLGMVHLSDYIYITNGFSPLPLRATNDFNGLSYGTTEDNINFMAHYGNTIHLTVEKSDGTLDERDFIYDGVTNTYIFN